MGEAQICNALTFAYYVTGHGLGHATRVVDVSRHLIAAGHEVHIVTAAPDYAFTREISSSKLHVRHKLLDSGAVQSDALTVDRLASLEEYVKIAVKPREELLVAEVAWLKAIGAHLVASDVVPLACAAAAQAGIPAVCVSNFSWDFIYSDYVGEAGGRHRPLVWQIAEDYSRALALIRLPGFCPMPAFRDVIDIPLVVREVRRSRQEVREELGLTPSERLLLFNFGGQDASWRLQSSFLPPGWKCLVCTALSIGELPSNFFRPQRDAYTPDLIAACDAMLGKIGYGTASEALAYRIPFAFVRRDFFNEEPFLRTLLDRFRTGVEMSRRDFLAGRWGAYLERALAIRPCFHGATNGGQVAAGLLEQAARGQLAVSNAPGSGAGRLQDAIVLGYQMHRAAGRKDVEVPDWYWGGRFDEPGITLPSQGKASPPLKHPRWGDGGAFDILGGSTQGLADTVEFLSILASLDEEGNVSASDRAAAPQVPERLAAGGMFRWDQDIYVTRAPGRLDVMGGIADYSGSLVLQMPIREACHVALQRTSPDKQPMWKHMKARQGATSAGGGPRAALRVVSFGSNASNRGPTFDMDLCDFLDSSGDGPISYAAARTYFAQDPSRAWAAYVAGGILVLMRERGVTFTDSISILVVSDVPEGKGVSSSAAIEVATMAAIAAAHGIELLPRDLAILCQMVENCVVGAPCGVMDQMASACGQEGRLLAMVCQPAEIRGHVPIPPNVRLWGLDSGIRHSVGGANYGSVRVGAFMGRTIIQEAARRRLVEAATGEVGDPTELLGRLEGDGDSTVSAIEEDAQLAYLCRLAPHRFESKYSALLPESISGAEFLRSFSSHGDEATSIDPDTTYAVRDPAAHPVNENFRVEAFGQLLSSAESDRDLATLGELMHQSHCSYSRCGLGSHGTDRLVALTKRHAQRATAKGFAPAQEGTLFGAKITGGGSGGTVCVLGRSSNASEACIEEIQQLYEAATGHQPYVFQGSSPGAAQFGFLRIRRKSQLFNLAPGPCKSSSQ